MRWMRVLGPAAAGMVDFERRTFRFATAGAAFLALLALASPTAAQPSIPEAFFEGWRGHQLVGQAVMGYEGEEFGEVRDLLLEQDGRVAALVVEGGGFLGIGVHAFLVPWSIVNLTPGEPGVVVSMSKAAAERAGMLDGSETVVAGPGRLRLSRLIGSAVRARTEGATPAILSDIVFGQDGQPIAAVLERPNPAGNERPAALIYSRASGGGLTWERGGDADGAGAILVLPADAVEIELPGRRPARPG